jgi:hypothetical protein
MKIVVVRASHGWIITMHLLNAGKQSRMTASVRAYEAICGLYWSNLQNDSVVEILGLIMGSYLRWLWVRGTFLLLRKVAVVSPIPTYKAVIVLLAPTALGPQRMPPKTKYPPGGVSHNAP